MSFFLRYAHVIKAWSEELHPRGKTTPESRGGSFKPAGGGAGGKPTNPESGYKVGDTIHLTPDQAPSWLSRQGKKKYEIAVRDKVTLSDTMASGGTVSTYSLTTLDGGRLELRDHFAPGREGGHFGPFDNGIEGKTVVLQPGMALVEHHIFMGKDMGMTGYVHPADAARVLPKKSSTNVSQFEEIVLHATAGLKSSYGGIKDFRMSEAMKETGIAAADYLSAKEALIARGLLDKRGAITPMGRNAIGGKGSKGLWHFKIKS
jgi:hypothetical protein